MSTDLLRLSSFINWPSNARISASTIARSGFFYLGHGDCCECFQCKLVVENWQSHDIPDEVHLKRSPSCSFILNKFKAKSVVDSANYQRDGLAKKTLVEPDSKPMPPGQQGKDDADAMLRPADRSIGGNHEARIDRSNPNYELLHSERVRLSTFYDWPDGARRIVDPCDLAKTGLYFTGQSDRVQCVFCRGYLRNWQKGDQPANEHRRHFPNCSFAQKQEMSNIRDVEDTHQEKEQEQFPVNLTETDVSLILS